MRRGPRASCIQRNVQQLRTLVMPMTSTAPPSGASTSAGPGAKECASRALAWKATMFRREMFSQRQSCLRFLARPHGSAVGAQRDEPEVQAGWDHLEVEDVSRCGNDDLSREVAAQHIGQMEYGRCVDERLGEVLAAAFREVPAREANEAIARARRERAGGDPDDE